MLLKGYGGTTTDASGNLVKDTKSSNTVTITSDNIPSHSHDGSYTFKHTHTADSVTDTNSHSHTGIKINSHKHTYNNSSATLDIKGHSHNYTCSMAPHQHQMYIYANDQNWKGGNAGTMRLYGDTGTSTSWASWLLCSYTTTTVNKKGVDAGGPSGYDYHSADESGTNLGFQDSGKVYGPEDNTGTLYGGGTYPSEGYGWWENVKGDTKTGYATGSVSLGSSTINVTVDSSEVTYTGSSVSTTDNEDTKTTTNATYNGDSSSGTTTTTTETTIDILPSSFKVYWLMKL
jgi:hypothetical protein